MSARISTDEENFLYRVKDLPVVNAGVEQAFSLYDKYLFNAVSTLNSMACSGLSAAEHRYPAITKQPSELKEEYAKTIETFKKLPAAALSLVPSLPMSPLSAMDARERVASINATSRQRVAEAAQALLAVIDYADSMVDGYVAAEDDVNNFNDENEYASGSAPQRLRIVAVKAWRGVNVNALNKVHQLNKSVHMTVEDARKVLRTGVQNIGTLPSKIHYLSPDVMLLRGVQAWVSVLAAMSEATTTRVVPLAEHGVTATNKYLHELKADVDSADSFTRYSLSKATAATSTGVTTVTTVGNRGVTALNDYTSAKLVQVKTIGGKAFTLTKETAELGIGMTILAMEQAARLPVIRDLIIKANAAILKEKRA